MRGHNVTKERSANDLFNILESKDYYRYDENKKFCIT